MEAETLKRSGLRCFDSAEKLLRHRDTLRTGWFKSLRQLLKQRRLERQADEMIRLGFHMLPGPPRVDG